MLAKKLNLKVLLLLFLLGGITSVGFFIKHSSSLRPKKILSKSILQKHVLGTGSQLVPTIKFTLLPSSASTTVTVQPTVYSGYCMKVPVLMYHHVAPTVLALAKGFSSLNVDSNSFDQQMGYLATHGYTSIFASTLVNALHNHTPLASKSIVVTLDDGYQDVYDYAFPSAKKYNIKLSLMIPTGLLGVNAGTNSYYSWAELHDMMSTGLVEPDNHTFSHYAMGTQGITKDQFEVSTAQQQLHSNVGITPIVFAWPYGTNAAKSSLYPTLQQNGIIGAFSTIVGSYQCDSFMYSLHRTRVGSISFPAYGIN